MDPDELAAFIADLPGAEPGFPFGPETRVWKVGGKVFALDAEVRGEYGVSLKALPENVTHLVAGVDGIGPGYHLNKKHWITVLLDGTVPAGHVQELVAESHAIVVSNLPKRLRLSLHGTESGSFTEP
ncbi:MmcQ/YjbR family DNA-binding protein [Microbacteriaceae bacterium VKM Ac-2855]|nr:MmcQ/YjbR family DNA-binding protein [Microbacteriaceae bacterium VKM Ac-2855]